MNLSSSASLCDQIGFILDKAPGPLCVLDADYRLLLRQARAELCVYLTKEAMRDKKLDARQCALIHIELNHSRNSDDSSHTPSTGDALDDEGRSLDQSDC